MAVFGGGIRIVAARRPSGCFRALDLFARERVLWHLNKRAMGQGRREDWGVQNGCAFGWTDGSLRAVRSIAHNHGGQGEHGGLRDGIGGGLGEIGFVHTKMTNEPTCLNDRSINRRRPRSRFVAWRETTPRVATIGGAVTLNALARWMSSAVGSRN